MRLCDLHLGRVAWVLLMVWAGAAPAARAQSPGIPAIQMPASGIYYHSPSAYAFPESLGPFKRTVLHNFEAARAGLGVGVEYLGDAGFADLYVYDFGGAAKGMAITDRDVLAHFDQVLADVKRMEELGHYRDVSVGSTRQQTAAVDGFPIDPFIYLRAEGRFEHVEKGRRVRTVALLGLLDGRFVKLRLSLYEDGENVEATATAIEQEFARLLADHLSHGTLRRLARDYRRDRTGEASAPILAAFFDYAEASPVTTVVLSPEALRFPDSDEVSEETYSRLLGAYVLGAVADQLEQRDFVFRPEAALEEVRQTSAAWEGMAGAAPADLL